MKPTASSSIVAPWHARPKKSELASAPSCSPASTMLASMPSAFRPMPPESRSTRSHFQTGGGNPAVEVTFLWFWPTRNNCENALRVVATGRNFDDNTLGHWRLRGTPNDFRDSDLSLPLRAQPALASLDLPPSPLAQLRCRPRQRHARERLTLGKLRSRLPASTIPRYALPRPLPYLVSSPSRCRQFTRP